MEYSKNERAGQLLGFRESGTAVLEPSELGYRCPVCKNVPMVNHEYDERLAWGEYNGFLWYSTCNRDFPSCLCVEEIGRAIDLFFASLDAAVRHSYKKSLRLTRRNNMGQKTLMEKILMEMPKDPIKACPEPLCADGLLWNEAIWDFGCQCPTCGGWGFVHDVHQNGYVHDSVNEEAAEQTAEAEEFDEYEIYYRDELIAEVKDYRKGFESVFYDLSDTTVVQKPPSKLLKIMPNKHVNNLS